MALDVEEQTLLLDLARLSVACAVGGQALPLPPEAPVCQRHAGAFVTLTSYGDLRGCIGQPEPQDSLGAVIVRCAAAAALEDPRFTPVIPEELPFLDYEISLLTPPVEVTDLSTIEVGRHGLIVARGRHRGLLLPQVAEEHRWSRDEFLMHTCRKAGLPADAWRAGAHVFRFAAEIFGDRTRRR
jgi:AmmeMemoRadiSam system protein A